MRRLAMIGWIGCLAAGVMPPAAPAADDPAGLAFFERKIRPVLVGKCYACHSAASEKVKGGLRLDTCAGLRAGGDTGPAFVPGKPGESLILEALRHEGMAMPPKDRLPEAVVADFERWIAIGAPSPDDGQVVAARAGIDIEAGRRFWSYRPTRRHAPPEVFDAGWPGGYIDRFLAAAREARGVRPAPDADRATLARRLYFDLIGLPPTPEELDAFLGDPSPGAYEALVDHLLASPHFGERWGRHWLDVARFGESLTLRGFVLKEAWRYRDYVIDAFNADMPFDRFIREQVAGDLLPATDLADARAKLVATSFLALGNTNLEEQDKAQLVMDVVDEQVDTIGKAFLAQTIGCARCHDHKFDPIPTRDYYALAGILGNVRVLEHANVSKWIERPLPIPPKREAEIHDHEASVATLEARVKEARRLAGGKGDRGGPILASELPGIVVDDARARRVGAWSVSQSTRSYVGDGYLHDDDEGKGEKTLTFTPELLRAGSYEVWLAYVTGARRSTAVPVTIFGADGEKVVKVNMREAPPIDGRFVSLGRHQFEPNGQGFVLVSNEGTKGHVAVDAVVFLPADAGGKDGAAPDSTGRDDALRELEAELKRLRAAGPRREMALSVVEEAKIEETRVHVRGSVHALGETAPRGVLRVATLGDPPAMPADQSGRVQLADWLADPANPLTSRVIVNRAWHWLFGAGLVRTVDNFGTTGEPPSHPELLNDLAVRFVEEGWSMKRLVRRIVLSRSYRLSDEDVPASRTIDPENRLRWRADRRRLDAECFRDAILSVGGRLSPDRGGPGFPPELDSDYGFVHADARRSVYAPVFRNALPEIFEAFDFADPSVVVGRRDVSTVAPQALFLLNHPFVLEQAQCAAHRLLAEPGLDRAGRIDRACRRALGRSPTGAEAAILRRAVDAGETEDAWASVFQALIGSADFRSIH